MSPFQLRTDYAERAAYRYLDLLGMVWVAALLLSTLAASKLVAFGPFILPGTIVVYSITYIFSDIFTEVYGYKATRRIIWSGLSFLLFANIVLYVISVLPPAASYRDQAAFATIFQTAPVFTAAAAGSYFAGEFANSYTLAKIKIYTSGRHLWVRTIGSTIAGMLVDNTVYVLIAYSWAYPPKDCVTMIASGWIFCIGYETLATPVTYRIVNWLKKTEGVDIYDRHTDFNPFHLH